MANKYRVLHGLHREGNRVYRGAYKTKVKKVVDGTTQEETVEVPGEVVDSVSDLGKQNFPDSRKFERVPDNTKVSPGKLVAAPRTTPQLQVLTSSIEEAKTASKPVKG